MSHVTLVHPIGQLHYLSNLRIPYRLYLYLKHTPDLQLLPPLLADMDHPSVHRRAHPPPSFSPYRPLPPLGRRIRLLPFRSLYLAYPLTPLLGTPPYTAVRDLHLTYLFQNLGSRLKVHLPA